MNQFNSRHKSIPVKVINLLNGDTLRFNSLKIVCDSLGIDYTRAKPKLYNQPNKIRIDNYLLIPNYKVKSIMKTPVVIIDQINNTERTFNSQYDAGKFLDTAQSNVNYAIRSGKLIKSRFLVKQKGIIPDKIKRFNKVRESTIIIYNKQHTIKFDQLKQAASFLGCASSTIRNHIKSGKAYQGYHIKHGSPHYYKATYKDKVYTATNQQRLADKLGLSFEQVNYAFGCNKPINGLEIKSVK